MRQFLFSFAVEGIYVAYNHNNIPLPQPSPCKYMCPFAQTNPHTIVSNKYELSFMHTQIHVMPIHQCTSSLYNKCTFDLMYDNINVLLGGR